MSLFALTPMVLQTLQADLRSGQWTPPTQQFFQQLFLRIGGASAPTNLELAQTNEMALGGETASHLAWLLSELDAVKAQVAAVWDGPVQTALSDLAPRGEVVGSDFDAAPRREDLPSDFDLAPVSAGSASEGDLSVRTEAVSADFDLGTMTWP